MHFQKQCWVVFKTSCPLLFSFRKPILFRKLIINLCSMTLCLLAVVFLFCNIIISFFLTDLSDVKLKWMVTIDKANMKLGCIYFLSKRIQTYILTSIKKIYSYWSCFIIIRAIRFKRKTLLLFKGFFFFFIIKSFVSNGRPFCFHSVSFSPFFFSLTNVV